MIPNRLHKTKAFSLPELLVASAIMLSIFAGTMAAIMKCMELAEMTRNSSMAVMALKNKVMEVEDADFAQVFNTYHNVSFTIPDINGIGVTYVDNTNADLLEVTAVFSWRQQNGRTMGEDQDLDGQLDAGEDLNGNGRLDSLVEVTTFRSNS